MFVSQVSSICYWKELFISVSNGFFKNSKAVSRAIFETVHSLFLPGHFPPPMEVVLH